MNKHYKLKLVCVTILTLSLMLIFTGCEKKVSTENTVSGNDAVIETIDNTEATIPMETESTVPVDEAVPDEATVSDSDDKLNNKPEDPETVIGGSVAESLPSNITPMDKTMYAIKSCNVRDIASDKGNKMYSLNKDDAVHVMGQDNDSKWYLLEDGYFVSDKYLTDVKPVAPTTPNTTESKPAASTSGSSSTPKTGSSGSTATTTTPTTPTKTPASTPTPAPAACQHTNKTTVHVGQGGHWVSGTSGCWQTGEIYKDVCADCGAVIRSDYEVLGEIDHSVTTNQIIDQSGVCGGQSLIYHEHRQCTCGAINEDGPQTEIPQPHSMSPYQFYDAEGNICESQYCVHCGYEDPNYTIIQYAEP